MADGHQTRLEGVQELTKENNFYMDRFKYTWLYDIIKDNIGIRPFPPRGSDFFNEDFEAIKDLHCEPQLKNLRHKTTCFKIRKEGKGYDSQETVNLITSKLIMNTIGIHFGYLSNDLDPETFTKEDLTFYFYDRTGLNLSLLTCLNSGNTSEILRLMVGLSEIEWMSCQARRRKPIPKLTCFNPGNTLKMENTFIMQHLCMKRYSKNCQTTPGRKSYKSRVLNKHVTKISNRFKKET